MIVGFDYVEHPWLMAGLEVIKIWACVYHLLIFIRKSQPLIGMKRGMSRGYKSSRGKPLYSIRWGTTDAISMDNDT